MEPIGVVVAVVAVVFVGQILHATVGFGDALVAVPVLSLLLGIRTATPLIALLGGTVTLLILAQSWREMEMASAWRLVAASALGIPVGVWLVGYAPEALSLGLLGIVVAGFALYSLARPTLPELHQQGWAYPAGFVAGVLGAAYTTNGPPVILYGTLRRWPPAKFRATLQGFFLPNSIMIMISHAVGGLWTRQIFTLYLIGLPAALIAFWLGTRLNRRIPAQRFTRAIYGILVLIGVILIVQAVG